MCVCTCICACDNDLFCYGGSVARLLAAVCVIYRLDSKGSLPGARVIPIHPRLCAQVFRVIGQVQTAPHDFTSC